jgi:hypothetical protein
VYEALSYWCMRPCMSVYMYMCRYVPFLCVYIGILYVCIYIYVYTFCVFVCARVHVCVCVCTQTYYLWTDSLRYLLVCPYLYAPLYIHNVYLYICKKSSQRTPIYIL